MAASENENDRIRLEAVSFETPTNPRVKYGLALPDGKFITVEVTVTPPEGRTGFTSYDEIFMLAKLELSRWLDEMAGHARARRPITG